MQYAYKFPAIRGVQAKKEYYTIMVPLKLLSKIFVFNIEDDEIPLDFKAQRSLNITRIPEIGEYIINNPETYVFSSLTASIDGEMIFEALSGDIGYLNIDMDARFLINDGQHRKAAIEYALKIDENLKDESISIVLYKDINLIRSQQMFADLNRHAVITTKSIGILYDSRDELAKITKNIINKINILRLYTDKEKSSLPKFSAKAFTLSNIYSANQRIFNNNKIDEKFLLKFWEEIINNIKEMKLLENKKITASEIRQSYIISYGTFIEALGIIGNYFFNNEIKNFEKILKKLNDINWNRENTEWQGRIIGDDGRIIKKTKTIKLTSNLIKNKLNIPLNEEEQIIETEFLKNG